MPTLCSVPLCDGRGGFRFPKDSATRKQWIQAISRSKGRSYGKVWNPDDQSAPVVCEKHFKPEDIEHYEADSAPGVMRRRLAKGAIPSIFPFNAKTKKVTGKKDV